jgi:hypothetical protein
MAAHGKMRASKNSSFNDASRRWQELAAVVNVSEFALIPIVLIFLIMHGNRMERLVGRVCVCVWVGSGVGGMSALSLLLWL